MIAFPPVSEKLAGTTNLTRGMPIMNRLPDQLFDYELNGDLRAFDDLTSLAGIERIKLHIPA